MNRYIHLNLNYIFEKLQPHLMPEVKNDKYFLYAQNIIKEHYNNPEIFYKEVLQIIVNEKHYQKANQKLIFDWLIEFFEDKNYNIIENALIDYVKQSERNKQIFAVNFYQYFIDKYKNKNYDNTEDFFSNLIYFSEQQNSKKESYNSSSNNSSNPNNSNSLIGNAFLILTKATCSSQLKEIVFEKNLEKIINKMKELNYLESSSDVFSYLISMENNKANSEEFNCVFKYYKQILKLENKNLGQMIFDKHQVFIYKFLKHPEKSSFQAFTNFLKLLSNERKKEISDEQFIQVANKIAVNVNTEIADIKSGNIKNYHNIVAFLNFCITEQIQSVLSNIDGKNIKYLLGYTKSDVDKSTIEKIIFSSVSANNEKIDKPKFKI